MQTVWGILLSRYNSTGDVVFGSVVSGRPDALQGVEEMIGLFSNTIPVRVRIEEGMTAKELLKAIQAESIESVPHHYVQLADVQSESTLGKGLFDHIMVFENYPVSEMLGQYIKGQGKEGEWSLLSTGNFEQNH